MRALGCAIAIAGAVTAFVGGRLAQFVLESALMAVPVWAHVWAGGVLLIGLFIVYATVPARRAG